MKKFFEINPVKARLRNCGVVGSYTGWEENKEEVIMRKEIGIYKITEPEAVKLAKEVKRLRAEAKKAELVRKWSEASSKLFDSEMKFFAMEVELDIAVLDGKTEKVDYDMDYSRDYEYFLDGAEPFILKRVCKYD